jgi:threonine/homoserine/homoserine lactone efflux protein
MDLTTLAAFAATSVAIELTPGPNMVWLAIVAASDGRRAGLAAVAGVALGLGIVGVAAAFGLAAIIAESPVAYQVLRWAGVAYLLWLAWDGWRGADEAPEHAALGSSLGKYFSRGLVNNLLNPKAFVFYIAVLPGFLPAFATLQAGLTDTLILSAVYVTAATIIHAGIVVLAGTARDWLTVAGRAVVMRRALALALVGVAVWMAWKTQT